MIEQAKAKFPLNTLKAAPWVQTLVQLLQRKAMSSSNLRDAEIWNQQLGSTLLNTPRLSSSTKSANKSMDSPASGGSDDGGDGSGGFGNASGVGVTQDAQLDDTSLELQLDILMQNALLSVLVGQRQSGVNQLSEGLAILQQNQWSGAHKFTIMYLLALAEVFMVCSFLIVCICDQDVAFLSSLLHSNMKSFVFRNPKAPYRPCQSC